MPAKAFTVTIAVGYGALAVFGWFTDGLLMGSPFRIPLEAADNVFHLVLGFAAALTLAVAPSSPVARRWIARRRRTSGEDGGARFAQSVMRRSG